MGSICLVKSSSFLLQIQLPTVLWVVLTTGIIPILWVEELRVKIKELRRDEAKPQEKKCHLYTPLSRKSECHLSTVVNGSLEYRLYHAAWIA